ncbi:MAG: hypothetical protein RRC07_18195 [Anaerolineae bacterium]|nr:hypothetical protein [Anaerolineae bacterium]
MKMNLQRWLGSMVQVDRRYVQLVVVLVTLLLFVLGGGAPVDSYFCSGC